MKIVVVGCGYVGLVSGACLADVGHYVVCVDQDTDRIALLNGGAVPVFEPGLDAVIARGVAAERLGFTSDIDAAVKAADVAIVAVGTPSLPGDGHADVSNVRTVADRIGAAIRRDMTIVVKSTVPVGTCDDVERIVRASSRSLDVSVVSNPEFMREGTAMADFMEPERIVIGVADARGREVMRDVYAGFAARGVPILFTSRRTSELVKYAANAFLAMKLTFINELADFCEAAGADVVDVSKGLGLDSRIGSRFLNAGPGYGGSCFPKDTLALMRTARDIGSPLHILETIVSINESRKRAMAEKVVRACGGSVHGRTIAILGLTFKPDTDDMRAAPSVAIVRALQDFGATIRAFDPQGMETARGFLTNVVFCRNPYEAAADADAAVVVTEWEMFRTLDLPRLGNAMRTPRIIDLRNIYEREYVEAAGLAYTGIGRGGGETGDRAPIPDRESSPTT